MQLPGVCQNVPEGRAQNGFQADILPDYPPQHLLHLTDNVVQIHFLCLNDLFPAKHQQLPAQRRGALAGGSDLGDQLM